MEIVFRIKFDDSIARLIGKELEKGNKVKIKIEDLSAEMELGAPDASEEITLIVKKESMMDKVKRKLLN